MSNNPRRVGKYVLGPRCKHTEDLGRLYRAHNQESGSPALVLEHTARQALDVPVADWKLLVSSSVAPAYLAIEVVSAPEGGEAEDAREELECVLEDAHLALAHALKSPETLRHLRSRRRPEVSTPAPVVVPRQQRLLGAALAACLGLLVLHAGNSSPPVVDDFSRPELAEARGDGGWEEGDVTGAALTGLADFEPLAISRPMPKKPFKIQKRAPCDPAIEEEHFGGCWIETKKSAPCPDKLYEQADKCYLPAVAAPPPPASISR